jgi:hypothetical protein
MTAHSPCCGSGCKEFRWSQGQPWTIGKKPRTRNILRRELPRSFLVEVTVLPDQRLNSTTLLLTVTVRLK